MSVRVIVFIVQWTGLSRMFGFMCLLYKHMSNMKNMKDGEKFTLKSVWSSIKDSAQQQSVLE